MKLRKRKIFIRQFLIYFLIGVSIGVILLIFAHIFASNKVKDELKSSLIENSTQLKTIFQNIENEAISDILMLSESPFVKDFLKTKKDSTKFAKTMKSFIKQSSKYHQFRFININGDEAFRVNHEFDSSYVVDASKLQNKRKRYYFTETIQLKEGEIFQSPIDLNIEYNKVEIPYRVMVRFGTPVFENDDLLGIILLNVDLTDYFHNFTHANQFQGEYCIINQDGYYLHSNDTALEFGFMFPGGQDKTVKKRHGDSAFVLNTEKMSITKTNNLLIYHDIYETDRTNKNRIHYYNNKTNDFHIIQKIPKSILNITNAFGSNILILIITIYLLILITISTFWAKNDVIKFDYRNQLIKKNEELNKNLDSQNKFFTILSHDLKNSLGGFYTYSEYLKENIHQFTNEELIKNFNLLEKSSLLQYNLLLSILEWKKLEMGKTEIKKVAINALDKFEEIKTLFSTRLLKKEIEIKLNIENGHTIFCDPNSFDAIFRNLIDNALKYSHEGSSIEISSFRSNNNDFVIVRDHGVGIPKEKLEILFEIKNYSTTKGTSEEAGTGFGLKLVESLVRHNNGEIKAQSIENEGTKFTVIFPCCNKLKII